MGGEYIEGVIGIPRYINPLYNSSSDVDSDISKLVYSSLFSHNKDGEIVKDLAEEYSVSEDNKEYIIKIRNDVKWHNGDSLTANDVAFTFNAIKDYDYNSPLRSSFLGVSIERIDEERVKFVLEEPYAAFLEFLTFGIMPESLWIQIPPDVANLAELNLKPIGSGPYRFKSLVKDKNGNIKTYNLATNKDYYKHEPYIENFSFKFFINTEEMASALNSGIIDGIGYLPRYAKSQIVAQDSLFFHELLLPHVTAIFFNQEKNPLLEDKKIRQALAQSIKKNEIISEVFHEEVRAIDGPILPGNIAYNKDIPKYRYNIEAAKDLFEEAGWELVEINEERIQEATENLGSEDEETIKKSQIIIDLGKGSWLYNSEKEKYLTIDITTVDNEDNYNVVERIKNSWEELGVKTNINLASPNEIQFNIIKPRNFEALFYGQIIGNDPDVYVFWHSSQIGESGLNIANYSNLEVDKLLEEARLSTNLEERIEKYHKFQEIIANDLPAIFMYSPVYIYVQSKKINSFNIRNILKPSDRFNNISEWYIKTGKKINW